MLTEDWYGRINVEVSEAVVLLNVLCPLLLFVLVPWAGKVKLNLTRLWTVTAELAEDEDAMDSSAGSKDPRDQGFLSVAPAASMVHRSLRLEVQEGGAMHGLRLYAHSMRERFSHFYSAPLTKVLPRHVCFLAFSLM